MTHHFEQGFEFWSFLLAAGRDDYFELGALCNLERFLEKNDLTIQR